MWHQSRHPAFAYKGNLQEWTILQAGQAAVLKQSNPKVNALYDRLHSIRTGTVAYGTWTLSLELQDTVQPLRPNATYQLKHTGKCRNTWRRTAMSTTIGNHKMQVLKLFQTECAMYCSSATKETCWCAQQHTLDIQVLLQCLCTKV